MVATNQYQTYGESAASLRKAIAKDKRNLEQATQQPTTSSNSAMKRFREGIYTDKPVLRGQFHKWGAILYPPLLGIPLFLKARGSFKTTRAAIIFNFAVELIMVVSARLHTVQWKTLEEFYTARKLDFMAIFVGIACFYSSMGRLLIGDLHPVLWNVIESVVWMGAVVGTVLKWRYIDLPPAVNGGVFLVQGWATLPCVPRMLQHSSWKVGGSLLAGAFFATMGTMAYICQWPKNVYQKAQRELVCGPHEVFHIGTILMFFFFWLSMWTKIDELQ